ncbi:DsbA family protein [Rhizosphaericola mali]|uniref:Thioredoxin domain-containing protein n=1 Tax=Rhizosphaericola mali TaxID=2545455 RepID=A0A5P2G4F5_9BACT|nr:thioredoxin domain-containing protein [Rhizosphaericola mali]QES90077.1 thioredoxin domain-containing protein [Rhizosphaericola mali]
MQLKPAVNQGDHLIGNNGSNLVIVEYGDYQCPYCGAAYPILKKILKEYGDAITFVFRNFPLSEMHPMARPAALAAEAANLQGKFWEMHDAIYENQDVLSSEFLLQLATKLNLDMVQFEKDIQSDKVNDKVDNDFESGVRSGVNGTPSFYINNQKFNGGAEDLLELLKENSNA